MGRPSGLNARVFTVGEVYEIEEILDAPVRVTIDNGTVAVLHRIDRCSLSGIRSAPGERMMARHAIRDHEHPAPCGCLIDARGAGTYIRLYWAKVRDAALLLRR